MDPLKQEFVDILRAIGWSQAETARQLCMTSGAVNQIINPNSTVRPSPTTLRLFKLIVAAERPSVINAKTLELKSKSPAPEGLSDEEQKLVKTVRRIPPQLQRPAFTAINSVLEALAGAWELKAPGIYRGTRKRRA